MKDGRLLPAICQLAQQATDRSDILRHVARGLANFALYGRLSFGKSWGALLDWLGNRIKQGCHGAGGIAGDDQAGVLPDARGESSSMVDSQQCLTGSLPLPL